VRVARHVGVKALNRIALLAGGALVAASATGCSSSTSAPAASGQATTDASTVAASGTTTPTSDASTGQVSSAASTTAGTSSSTDPNGFPPPCDNAKLNISLAPAGDGQKASVYLITVKNAGPSCDIGFLPYVSITAGQHSSPPKVKPLIENGLGGAGDFIAPGQTQYAGIDLDPQSASNAVAGYTSLEVTASYTQQSTSKDVRDLMLPAPAKVAGAKLGTYSKTKAAALKAMTYGSVPEDSQY